MFFRMCVCFALFAQILPIAQRGHAGRYNYNNSRRSRVLFGAWLDVDPLPALRVVRFAYCNF